jgi:hypothetical protein
MFPTNSIVCNHLHHQRRAQSSPPPATSIVRSLPPLQHRAQSSPPAALCAVIPTTSIVRSLHQHQCLILTGPRHNLKDPNSKTLERKCGVTITALLYSMFVLSVSRGRVHRTLVSIFPVFFHIRWRFRHPALCVVFTRVTVYEKRPLLRLARTSAPLQCRPKSPLYGTPLSNQTLTCSGASHVSGKRWDKLPGISAAIRHWGDVKLTVAAAPKIVINLLEKCYDL